MSIKQGLYGIKINLSYRIKTWNKVNFRVFEGKAHPIKLFTDCTDSVTGR